MAATEQRYQGAGSARTPCSCASPPRWPAGSSAAIRPPGGNSSFYSFLPERQRAPAAYRRRAPTWRGDLQVVPFSWNSCLPVVRGYQQAMRAAGIDELSHASLEGYTSQQGAGRGYRRTAGNSTERQDHPGRHEPAGPGRLHPALQQEPHAGSGFPELNLRPDGCFVKIDLAPFKEARGPPAA